MQIVNWTTLDRVVNDIYDTIPEEYWNECNILEWILIASGKLDIHCQYQPRIKYCPVANYKFTLPKGLIRIEMVVYKSSTSADTELADIQREVQIDNDSYFDAFLLGTASKNYKPLRLATSPFSIGVHCDDCKNIDIISEHNYSIHPDGFGTTSFNKGSVCIAYLSQPMDEDGNIKIPAEEDYLDALRLYCLYRFWEHRMNMKEEGARTLYADYLAMWDHKRRAVPARLMFPDTVDEMENLRTITDRLIPKTRRYYSVFGMLNADEGTYLL